MKRYCPPSNTERKLHFETIVTKPVQKIIDGVVCKSFERSVIEPSKVNEGLLSSDFYIETLVENNATDLLKQNSTLRSSSKLNIAEQIENFESYE